MKSQFGLLDVTVGRRELERRLRAGEQIEVVIYGTLDNDPRSWNDDGTSTEFTVAVDRFTIGGKAP